MFEKSSTLNSQPGPGAELVDMAAGTSAGRPPSPTLKEKFMNFVGESEKPKELKDREKVEKRLTEVCVWGGGYIVCLYVPTVAAFIGTLRVPLAIHVALCHGNYVSALATD